MSDAELSISDVTLIARLRNTPNWMREGFQNWKDNVRTYDTAPFEAADRIEALEAKLAAIDDLMVRRIKHHQEMKDLKGSGTAQKREHYKLHALSEALGEIRKVTKGESHD